MSTVNNTILIIIFILHYYFIFCLQGNVVMHYKRYSKDKWLPDPEDATTYLSDNDRCGILVFNVRVLLN